MKLASSILSFLLIPIFINAQSRDKIIYKSWRNNNLFICNPDFTDRESLISDKNFIPIGITEDLQTAYYFNRFHNTIIFYDLITKTQVNQRELSHPGNTFKFQEDKNRILYCSAAKIYSLSLQDFSEEELYHHPEDSIAYFDEYNDEFILSLQNKNGVFLSNKEDSFLNKINLQNTKTIIWDHEGKGFYYIDKNFFHFNLENYQTENLALVGNDYIWSELFKLNNGIAFTRGNRIVIYKISTKKYHNYIIENLQNGESIVDQNGKLGLNSNSIGIHSINLLPGKLSTIEYQPFKEIGDFSIDQLNSSLLLMTKNHIDTVTSILQVNWTTKQLQTVYQSSNFDLENDKIYLDYYTHTLFGSNHKTGRTYKINLSTNEFNWILDSLPNKLQRILAIDPINKLVFYTDGQKLISANMDQMDVHRVYEFNPKNNLSLDIYNRKFYNLQSLSHGLYSSLEYDYNGNLINSVNYQLKDHIKISDANNEFYLKHNMIYGFSTVLFSGGDFYYSNFSVGLSGQMTTFFSDIDECCPLDQMRIFYHHIYTNTKDEHNRSMDMLVYPNPLQRELLIIPPAHAGDISRASIVSISGLSFDLEIENTQNASYRFSLPTVPAGVYILNLIMQGGKRISQKIIISP